MHARIVITMWNNNTRSHTPGVHFILKFSNHTTLLATRERGQLELQYAKFSSVFKLLALQKKGGPRGGMRHHIVSMDPGN